MSRLSSYRPASRFEDEGFEVELIGLPDDSPNPEDRVQRVEMLIAKVILQGRARGRPKKRSEDEYEEKTAA